jgi:hypothetical protein
MIENELERPVQFLPQRLLRTIACRSQYGLRFKFQPGTDHTLPPFGG